MAWHSAWAEATSSSAGVIHLSSDGSWASATVYVRDGGFSGTLLGYEYGYNEYFDGSTHYINVYMNGLQSGRTYYLYVSYQTSGGATNLYDVSPTTLTMPQPKPFRGNLESPYSGQTVTDTTINVSGWALDESGINYLAVYIDGYSKGTTRTVVTRYDIYNSYPEYNSVNCGFQCYIDLANITYASHTLDVVAVTNSGYSYSLGSIIFYRQPSRPSTWQWSRSGYSLYSGGGVYGTVTNGTNVTAYIIPATEWNNFTTRINQFRTYKGYSTAGFTIVARDTLFDETIMNQAINAINPMCNYPMTTASDKSGLYASYFTVMEYYLSIL
jgi:hypothetical protein